LAARAVAFLSAYDLSLGLADLAGGSDTLLRTVDRFDYDLYDIFEFNFYLTNLFKNVI
jgi:hypothetical protein